MPSKSKQQQKFMGIVRAIQKGDEPASKFSKDAQDAADDMKKKDVEDFASTKHKGLPKKVEQTLREKIRTMVEDYVESCGYVVSAKDPNYKLKSPGGTGEEDKELKENAGVPNKMRAGFKKLKNKEGLSQEERNELYKAYKGIVELLTYGNFYDNKKPNKRRKELSELTFDINYALVGSKRLGSYQGRFEAIFKKFLNMINTQIKREEKGLKTDYRKAMRASKLDDVKNIFKNVTKYARTQKGIQKGTNEGFGSDEFLTKTEKKKFEKERLESAEVLGYELTGVKDVNENINEDGHTDVASSKRKVMIMVDDSNKLLNKLNGMNKEDSLPSWWSDKITLSQNYLQKATNYLLNPVESVNEAMSKSQASELLKQLGGNKFISMTGAKNLTFSGLGLVMQIGKNSKGVTHVRFKLSSKDLYDIDFLSIRGSNVKTKSKEKGVFVDQLGKIFKKNTGLKTGLKESINEMSAKSKKVINKLGKKEKEVFLTMVDMLGFDQVMSDYKRDKKAFKQALKDMTESVFAVRQDKIKNGERFPKEPNFEYDPEKGKSRIRKVNEGKGVDKIMKMADDYSYGKIAGKTVDVMTAKLFQAVYKKASQKARDRVDKMNEKQLYIFMMNLWKKFGKQLTLSS